MQTQILKRSRNIVNEIVRQLDQGQVIILPTDTTYAFVANAFNKDAVAQLRQLRSWDASQPIGVFTRTERAKEVVVTTPSAEKLMAHFPYPVTMVMEAKETLAESVTHGFKNIFVVCPDQFIYDLIMDVPFPMACASVTLASDINIKVKKFETAKDFFEGKVPLIVDGGTCQYGRSGTLIDFTVEVPQILRFGPVSFDDLKPIVPDIELPAHMRK